MSKTCKTNKCRGAGPDNTRLKQHDNWMQHTTLWGIPEDPGAGKTAVTDNGGWLQTADLGCGPSSTRDRFILLQVFTGAVKLLLGKPVSHTSVTGSLHQLVYTLRASTGDGYPRGRSAWSSCLPPLAWSNSGNSIKQQDHNRGTWLYYCVIIIIIYHLYFQGKNTCAERKWNNQCTSYGWSIKHLRF